MNNLVYLAGPITGCTYDGCTGWRQKVMDSVPSFIHTISPMRGKQRLREKISGEPIEDHYDDNPLTTTKGINSRDYFDVSRCDVVFVNFLGASRVSIGTVMEIAWAKALGKLVICVMEKDNIHHHAMVNECCAYIVDSLDQGIDILISSLSTDRQYAEVDSMTTYESH